MLTNDEIFLLWTEAGGSKPHASPREFAEKFARVIERSLASSMAAPQGWKLVPIEPTTVMDNEGVIAFAKEGYGATQADARACYRAMLAAAPAVPSDLKIEGMK